jgi:homoserine dehydrogenase
VLGLDLAPEAVGRDVLSATTLAAAAPWPDGGPLRHVAVLTVEGGAARGEVRLLQVAPADPLARVQGAGNAAVITLASGEKLVIEGNGAGRWPTAEAVMADVLAVARRSGARRAGNRAVTTARRRALAAAPA